MCTSLCYLPYKKTCQIFLYNLDNYNWGEPERAPHKREVRAVSLSVCLSVCRSVRTFMTRKYTRVILIYGVPSVVDCSV